MHAALQALTEQPLMVLALARPEVQDLYPNLGRSAGAAAPKSAAEEGQRAPGAPDLALPSQRPRWPGSVSRQRGIHCSWKS